MNNWGEKVSFIWSVADLLRGPHRPNQYKDVMLPMTVLRRLDCVLEPTKHRVLAKMKSLKGSKVKNLEPILNKVAGQAFHNTSRFTFEKLKGDPNNIAANLTHYIKVEKGILAFSHWPFPRSFDICSDTFSISTSKTALDRTRSRSVPSSR